MMVNVELLFKEMAKGVDWGGSEFGVGPWLFGLTVATNARRVIEIGRYTGFSTIALAGGLAFLSENDWNIPECQFQRPGIDYRLYRPGNSNRQLFSIDMNPKTEARDRVGRLGLGEHVRFIDEDSHTVDMSQHTQTAADIDILLVDGDHTYDGAKRDVEKFAPLVVPGGYVILHDYFGWYDNQSINQSPVKVLCDEMSTRPGWQSLLVDTKYMSLMAFRTPGEAK